MVRVTGEPVGQDDDAGAEEAKDGGDLESIFQGVLDVAVGQIESFAPGDAEYLGGFGGSAARCSAVPRVPSRRG